MKGYDIRLQVALAVSRLHGEQVVLGPVVEEGESEIAELILRPLIEGNVIGIELHLAVSPLALLDIDDRMVLAGYAQSDGVIDELVQLRRALYRLQRQWNGSRVALGYMVQYDECPAVLLL